MEDRELREADDRKIELIKRLHPAIAKQVGLRSKRQKQRQLCIDDEKVFPIVDADRPHKRRVGLTTERMDALIACAFCEKIPDTSGSKQRDSSLFASTCQKRCASKVWRRPS